MTEADKVGFEFFMFEKYGTEFVMFDLPKLKKAYKEYEQYKKEQNELDSVSDEWIVNKPDEINEDFDENF